MMRNMTEKTIVNNELKALPTADPEATPEPTEEQPSPNVGLYNQFGNLTIVKRENMFKRHVDVEYFDGDFTQLVTIPIEDLGARTEELHKMGYTINRITALKLREKLS